MLKKISNFQRKLFKKNFGKCLIVAEYEKNLVKESTYAAIGAASQIGSAIVLVTGKDCHKIAKKISTIKEVEKVLVADYSEFKFKMPEIIAPFISQLSRQFSHVIFG